LPTMTSVSVPTTVKRYRFDSEEFDTLDYDEWLSRYAKYAMFAIEYNDGIVYDVTEWVMDLQLTHNELDKEGAGRDAKTGKMVRKILADKHEIQINLMPRTPHSVAHRILMLVCDGDTFTLYWQHPCRANKITSAKFYCSTVNFGAQRYEKGSNKCFYTGMTFKVIEV